MAFNAPGLHWRKGMTLMDAVREFSNEDNFEAFFVDACWPNDIACPEWGSLKVLNRVSRKPQSFRCRDCYFSVCGSHADDTL